MFFKFWKLSGKGDLKSLATLLYEDLTTWETDYQEAHASDFTREEMIRFHNEADNSPDHTFWKAFTSIATSFAARSSEPCNIQFISAENQIRIMRLDNSDFRIMYERSKKRGKDKKHVDKFSTISGDLEKASVQRMWDAFPAIPVKGCNGEMNGRTGRFFRYLQQTKDGKLISTLKNIRKNV